MKNFIPNFLITIGVTMISFTLDEIINDNKTNWIILFIGSAIIAITWIFYLIHFFRSKKGFKELHTKSPVKKPYNQISSKQKKLLNNLSTSEKHYIEQFYVENDRALEFEPNAILQELCDKDILNPPGISGANDNDKYVALYRINDWAWYYLKDNQHLLE